MFRRFNYSVDDKEPYLDMEGPELDKYIEIARISRDDGQQNCGEHK